MLDAIKLPAAVLAGALAGAMPAYVTGYFQGKGAAGVAALETSINVLRKRGEVDAEISAAAARELCGHFGLRDDERDECVRRLAAADADAGDGGARDHE